MVISFFTSVLLASGSFYYLHYPVCLFKKVCLEKDDKEEIMQHNDAWINYTIRSTDGILQLIPRSPCQGKKVNNVSKCILKKNKKHFMRYNWVCRPETVIAILLFLAQNYHYHCSYHQQIRAISLTFWQSGIFLVHTSPA